MTLERTTLHVSDNTGRIAIVETRTQGSDTSPQQPQRYVYSNHLGSASLELNETADVISYEEYHPYGTTSYQAMNATINAVAKRYRYTGKERDEESGLYYHGARYYIPWLCRWSAVDPKESKYAGWSAYQYCTDNPVNHTDSTGQGNDEWLKKKGGSAADNTSHAPINHTGGSIPIPNAEQLGKLIDSANAGNTNVSSTRVDRAHVHHQAIAKKIEAIEMLRPKAYIGQKKEEHLTPEQMADLKAITSQMLEAEGYTADGEKGFLRKLSENKHFQGFAENIVGRTVDIATVYDGVGLAWEAAGKAVAERLVAKEGAGVLNSERTIFTQINNAGGGGDVLFDPVKLERIKASLAKQGIITEQGGENVEAVLRFAGAKAAYMAPFEAGDAPMLYFKEHPSRTEVIEELLHLGQNRKMKFAPVPASKMVDLEIEAQHTLLKLGENRNWSNSEMDEIRNALKIWQGLK